MEIRWVPIRIDLEFPRTFRISKKCADACGRLKFRVTFVETLNIPSETSSKYMAIGDHDADERTEAAVSEYVRRRDWLKMLPHLKNGMHLTYKILEMIA